jgi:hypothetical protein
VNTAMKLRFPERGEGEFRDKLRDYREGLCSQELLIDLILLQVSCKFEFSCGHRSQDTEIQNTCVFDEVNKN